MYIGTINRVEINCNQRNLIVKLTCNSENMNIINRSFVGKQLIILDEGEDLETIVNEVIAIAKRHRLEIENLARRK